MSTTTEKGAEAVAELFHYGKKGMKWGVRNDKGHEGERVKIKKLDKLDKQWEADMNRHGYMKLYNAAANKMNNGGIDAINNKPEYLKAADDGILNDLNHPTTKKYYQEHEDAFQKAMVEAGPSLGMNPSGTKQFVIKKVANPDGEDYEDVFLEPVNKKIKHVEGDTALVFRLNRNSSGLVTEYVSEELELMHYGVPGMKWGRRKRDTGPTEAVATQRKPGTKLVTAGGKNLPASEDAKRAAISRQKAKASSTDSLSNKELQDLVNRMNLEQNYARLSAPKKSAGKKFIDKLFKDEKFAKKTFRNASAATAYPRAAAGVGDAIRRTNLENIY